MDSGYRTIVFASFRDAGLLEAAKWRAERERNVARCKSERSSNKRTSSSRSFRLEHRVWLSYGGRCARDPVCKGSRPNAPEYFKSSDSITINYRFFFAPRPVHPDSLNRRSIAINHFPFFAFSSSTFGTVLPFVRRCDVLESY